MENCEGLCYAVIERAIEDLKELTLYGIVKDGKITIPNPVVGKDGEVIKDFWPRFGGRKIKVLGYYDSIPKVNELLRFFKKGGCEFFLSLANSDISYKTISNKFGV